MNESDQQTLEPPIAAAPRRGSIAFKIFIRILLALTVGVSVFAVKAFLFGDHARSAEVGDCINGPGVEVTDQTVARAKVVDCGSADAKFQVAGRVAGVTDTDSPECDKFFQEGEKFVVYSSTSSGGYLLCLKPR